MNDSNYDRIKSQIKFSEFIRIICQFTKIIVLVLVSLLLIVEIIRPIQLNIEFSKEIYSNNNELIAAFLTSDHKWRLKTELDEVSPNLIQSILHKEDKYFYCHFGINPISIIKAFTANIINRGIKSGASTISMQTIRMLERRPRTYFNKLIEMFRAFELEMRLSKKEILELYLSLLPYGGNIEGVESASYIYFNIKPAGLSLAQAVTLSIIPNNPNKYRLDESAKVLNFRNKWLERFANDKLFSDNLIADARNERISVARYEIPNYIPQLAQKLKQNIIFNSKLKSTIDLRLQTLLARLLLRHQNDLTRNGINNSAAMIVDNITHSVVAYCGSSDFKDSLALGQNNGLIAMRSPGSTLKPALYGLGLDLGIITPKTILYDIPTDFGGYMPENFSSKFYGAVTAEFALYNSLNIPPVKLLQKIRIERFKALLTNAGFTSISRRSKQLGLSMVLGACETNAEELIALYSAFANSGMKHNIRYTESEIQDSTRLFSPSAAYLISKMLSTQSDRIENQMLKMKRIEIPDISWKTGTSFGKRDAWAIGFHNRYTILVWCGNFDGKGSPTLIGGEVALPILFEVFKLVKPTNYILKQPKDIEIREICKESGLIPNGNCTNIETDYAIKRVTLPNKCELHNVHYISPDSAEEYCSVCLPVSNYTKAVFADYSAEYIAWADLNQKIINQVPTHNSLCTAKFSSDRPQIISPSADFVYYIERDARQELCLQSIVTDKNSMMYWYIDNQLYAKSRSAEKVFFAPDKDEYLIKCISRRGGETEINIKIVYY